MTQATNNEKLALFDWDETMHSGPSMLPWMRFLASNGCFDAVWLTRIEEMYANHFAGTVSYDQHVDEVVSGYARGLAGQEVLAVAHLAAVFAKKDRAAIFPYVPPLLRALRDAGITPVIISGSGVDIIAAHARLLGISHYFATELCVSSGTSPHYTGAVLRNTATAGVKRQLTAAFTGSIILAAGDSTADVPMLEKAMYRIVVGNPSLFPLDPHTFHISRDMTHRELSALRQFLKVALSPPNRELSA